MATGDHPPGSEPFDVTLPEGFELGCTDRRSRRQPSRRVARSSAMARTLSCAASGRSTTTTRRGSSRRRWTCPWRASPSVLGEERSGANRVTPAHDGDDLTRSSLHRNSRPGGRCPKTRAALRIMRLAGEPSPPRRSSTSSRSTGSPETTRSTAPASPPTRSDSRASPERSAPTAARPPRGGGARTDR